MLGLRECTGAGYQACARLLGMLLVSMAFAAQAAQTLVAGPTGAPMTLAEAVTKAADGDTIELLPGDYTAPLVLEQRRLTLRGMGKVLVTGGGKVGKAKAMWTVKGGAVAIENVEFRGARSEDGGGAGVRLESGQLTLRSCLLFDNEHGLTTGHDESAQLTIERSVFGLAPRVVGGLYHLLDVGRIGRLHVTGSRFQQGFEGHLIKSRARETFIGYNFVHDGVRGGASYEIDIANGGLATIIGNVIGQGVDAQHRVLVAYGAEGKAWERNKLVLAHNTLISYGWLPAWFLRSFTDRLPEDTQIVAVNNLIVGPGLFWLGSPGRFEGNRHALSGMLRDVETHAFELVAGSVWRDSGVDPSNIDGMDLRPKAEFEFPATTVPIAPRTRGSPGAYQR